MVHQRMYLLQNPKDQISDPQNPQGYPPGNIWNQDPKSELARLDESMSSDLKRKSLPQHICGRALEESSQTRVRPPQVETTHIPKMNIF